MLQVFALLVLHYHVYSAVFLKEIEHVYNVGVFQGCQGAGFLEEKLATAFETALGVFIPRADMPVAAAFGQFARNVLLDDHLPAIVNLCRTVDYAEPASTQRFFQQVTIESCAGFQAV